MRPTSANKRRRRNVATEARRAPVGACTGWTAPTRTGLAWAPATGGDAGANASGPLIGAALCALTPRAHIGRGARRIAMRLRRPVARSVVKIGAMVAPPWGRVSGMQPRSSWSRCWHAGTEWIKSRGCDTRLRSVFPVVLSDHRGMSASRAWFRPSQVVERPFGFTTTPRTPVRCQATFERMFAANMRSCYLLHQPGGQDHE